MPFKHSAYQACKRKLPDEQLCAALIPPDLSEGHRPWAISACPYIGAQHFKDSQTFLHVGICASSAKLPELSCRLQCMPHHTGFKQLIVSRATHASCALLGLRQGEDVQRTAYPLLLQVCFVLLAVQKLPAVNTQKFLTRHILARLRKPLSVVDYATPPQAFSTNQPNSRAHRTSLHACHEGCITTHLQGLAKM